MPIVNGAMYPEARPRLNNFNVLNVLLLGEIADNQAAFAIQVDTLRVYTENTLGTAVRVKLHSTNVVDDAQATSLGIERHDIDPPNEETLVATIKQLDIDVVLDQADTFSKRFIQNNFYTFQVVKTLPELISSCEDFLTGHNIPWIFSFITWNLPLLMRYTERSGIASEYFAFMSVCTATKGYSTNQQDRVRYITNRLCQIEYSKDILNFYIKRMRKAERNGFADDDYNFELNYHLSNYYFLIAGVMDSVARLLNDVYRLELTRYADLGVEKDNFITANRRKRTGFVRILTNTAFLKWLSFMKERRNFIAHDGDMRQSPLVEPNDTPLTDAEVERLVDGEVDWAFAARMYTPAQIQARRNQAAEIIRIQEDYHVIAKNVMVVPDATTGGTKVYQPLRSVDYEYEKLSDVMLKLLERLKS